jgi:hypothetical protein
LRQAIEASGLRPLAFMEYDVEYVVPVTNEHRYLAVAQLAR